MEFSIVDLKLSAHAGISSSVRVLDFLGPILRYTIQIPVKTVHLMFTMNGVALREYNGKFTQGKINTWPVVCVASAGARQLWQS